MPLSFAELRRLQFGGFADTAALLAAGAGVMATHPVLAPASWPLATALGLGLGGVGGGWLGYRWDAIKGGEALEGSSLHINSSEPPECDDGMHLGYIVDSGKPLVIPWRDWRRHAMIVGQTGVGKTVMGSWLMLQQIARGGGMLWVDGKLDSDNVLMLREMCAWAGREDDLLIINPGNPDQSNTYNPILFGDPDEVSSRCISLIPSTEANAGADYYRQEANQGITTLVSAMQACGLAYSFGDMSVLLSNAEALEWLEKRVPYGTDAKDQFSLFLHKFKVPQRNGQVAIDLKKLKDQLGGIGGRMFTFGTGAVGKVLNSYAPEVRLKEDLLANKIIYVMLPTMGKAEAASNLGKMVTGDFRSAIAQVQALPPEQRPGVPPILSFFDECGSYVTQAWSRIFEQARSAGLMMVPAFQTRANLEILGEELLDTVAGNTLTKMFFKPGEPNTAEWFADMIGKEFAAEYSITANRGSGSAKAAHLAHNPQGWSDSGATAFSEGRAETHKITPTELTQLGQGECVVTFNGSNVYHIRVPLVTFDDQIRAMAMNATVNRQRTRYARGINISSQIQKWIGGGAE